MVPTRDLASVPGLRLEVGPPGLLLPCSQVPRILELEPSLGLYTCKLHNRRTCTPHRIVAKSPATINPIIPFNNTSIIHLNSHSKCIVNGHSYKADRICQ